MQYLHEFLDKHHPKILCLQETWLLKCNLKKLSEIHPDYMFHGISAMDSDKNIIPGRPYGGVALLWHKSICDKVSKLDCDSERLCAIRMCLKIILIYLLFALTCHVIT